MSEQNPTTTEEITMFDTTCTSPGCVLTEHERFRLPGGEVRVVHRASGGSIWNSWDSLGVFDRGAGA